MSILDEYEYCLSPNEYNDEERLFGRSDRIVDGALDELRFISRRFQNSKEALMPDQEIVENLLGSIPTGETIVDSREGDHAEATLTNPELVPFGTGHAVQVTWTNLQDVDGRAFEYKERYGLPTSQSEPWQHGRFLDVVQSLGLVPKANRNAINVDSDVDRAAVLAAFKKVKGNVHPIKINTNKKTGYLQSRIVKQRKAA